MQPYAFYKYYDSLSHFLMDAFNENTVDRQIAEQKRIANQAMQEADRLQSIKASQYDLPWYQWDGVIFKINGQVYSCSDEFDSYVDFVVAFLKEVDGEPLDDKTFYRRRKPEFVVRSPNKEDYYLKDEEANNMPLIKEFYERKAIQEKMKAEKKKIDSIQKNIESLNIKIENTNKYTLNFISELTEKRDKLLEELQISTNLASDEQGEKQLAELNQVLLKVDEKLGNWFIDIRD